MFVDPDGGAGFSQLNRSGWWYEGAGIYRHSRLVRTPQPLQISQDGVVARSSIKWPQLTVAGGADAAAAATSATLTIDATIVNTGRAAAAPAGSYVNLTLVETSTGVVVGSATTANRKFAAVPTGGKVTATATIVLPSPNLWAARTPTMYTVKAELCRDGSAVIDSVSVSHGFRDLTFDGTDGQPSCTLNRRPFKWRGFCDHGNFAVVGGAVPDRIKLFRAQMSRAVGGNARRT